MLDQLDRRVPDWVADDPSQAVLAALADAEAQGRGAIAEEELVAALGAGGTSILDGEGALGAPPVRAGGRPARRPGPSEACDGRATWLKAAGRTATWRALTRDGSVE